MLVGESRLFPTWDLGLGSRLLILSLSLCLRTLFTLRYEITKELFAQECQAHPGREFLSRK